MFIAYLTHANMEGIAWPGRELICRETGLHDDSVSTARSGLVRKGWLFPKGQVRRTDGTLTGALRFAPIVPDAGESPAPEIVRHRRKSGTGKSQRTDAGVFRPTDAGESPALSSSNEVEPKEEHQHRLHDALTSQRTAQTANASADDLVDQAKGIFLRIPVSDGEYNVHIKAVADWEREFPGVDVRQEIRSTRAFWLARPIEQRKARHEIRQSLRWHLSRQQDGAGEPEGWET